MELVGRDDALAQADCFLENLSRKGEGGVLLVTAAAGMGQSHFLREVKVRAQTGGLECYLETGYPGGLPSPGSLLRCLPEHIGEGGSVRSRWMGFLSRLGRPRGGWGSESIEEERRLRRAAEVRLAAAAVREPFVLVVDGVQFFDELSIELLSDLVQVLHEPSAARRPPVGLVLGFREEGPFAPLLREVFKRLIERERGRTLTLRPLNVEETLDLLTRRGGPLHGEDGGLAVFQKTGGCPARIAALTPGGTGRVESEPPISPGAVRERLATTGAAGRRILLVLIALRRPATEAELFRFTRIRRRDIRQVLKTLATCELVISADVHSDRCAWVTGPAAEAALGAARDSERRAAHVAIAKALAARPAGKDDGSIIEAIRHFRAAGRSAEVVRLGLPAARRLKATFQSRAALDIFRDVLHALPARSTSRLEVALEMADLHARTGAIDEGIRVLTGDLGKRVSSRDRRRLLRRLASLHTRNGEFRRADALFREGLRGWKQAVHAGPERHEVLHFLNEHAAAMTFLGRHEEALELCEEGLRRAPRSHAERARDVRLNLHATRANIALRTFNYDAATRDLERALELAEATGDLGNQAIILNYLGIVYGQCDRYRDAIRAFRESERISIRVHEGPSLASIYSNLAVLHARVGDFSEVDSLLEQGHRLIGASLGRRQEYFIAHAHGLCLLYRGRYRESRGYLEESIRLLKELGNRYVLHFEEVHRAECLIFDGAYREATRELNRQTAAPTPPRAQRMALARLALLAGWTAQSRVLDDALRRRAAIDDGHQVPFLDAWDELYIGWGLVLLRRRERAAEHLDAAERFFRSHRLRPGLAALSCVRAEDHFLAGECERAEAVINAMRAEGNEMTSIFRALLEARLLLTAAGAPGEASLRRGADLLAWAGDLLIGNPMPELEARLEALRAAHDPGGDSGAPGRSAGERRIELSRELKRSARKRYLESPSWQGWAGDLAAAPAQGRTPSPAYRGKRGSQSTRTLSRRSARADPARRRLIGRSNGVRHLLAALDRLRESDKPVLIEGETGAGKDLVARIVHEESHRRAGPFRAFSCAGVPEGLIEAELFGVVAGAFTDGKRSRPGLLESARGGTIYLDELSVASATLQSKLLRVLSEGTFRPLGADEDRAVGARFVVSTSRDLAAEVAAGRFRADLFHRIHVLRLHVPPLRERTVDLPGLVELFLRQGERPAARSRAGRLGRACASPLAGKRPRAREPSRAPASRAPGARHGRGGSANPRRDNDRIILP